MVTNHAVETKEMPETVTGSGLKRFLPKELVSPLDGPTSCAVLAEMPPESLFLSPRMDPGADPAWLMAKGVQLSLDKWAFVSCA